MAPGADLCLIALGVSSALGCLTIPVFPHALLLSLLTLSSPLQVAIYPVTLTQRHFGSTGMTMDKSRYHLSHIVHSLIYPINNY